jgi:flagellar motor component MotA
MFRFSAGLILLFALIIGCVVLEGFNPIHLLQPTTLLIIVFCPIFASLAVWKVSSIKQAFQDALGKKKNESSFSRSVRIWSFYERVFYLIGIIGFIVGLILILGRLSTDVLENMRSLAAAFVINVYALLFGLFARILKYCVLKRNAKNNG